MATSQSDGGTVKGKGRSGQMKWSLGKESKVWRKEYIKTLCKQNVLLILSNIKSPFGVGAFCIIGSPTSNNGGQAVVILPQGRYDNFAVRSSTGDFQ